MAVLLCPLCSQPRFNNLESLRLSLINAATQSISCPICNEVLMGLDKLTIHLFGHTLNQNAQNSPCMELKISKPEELNSKSEVNLFNTPTDSFPTEICDAPTIDFPNEGESENLKNVISDFSEVSDEVDQSPTNPNPTTVNMEDLSFLTSWENTFRTEDSKDSGSKSPHIIEEIDTEEPSKSVQEDSTELSEYMSDLLNKKLPVLNFVFTMDTPEKNKPIQEPENKQFKCPTCDFVFQNSIILSMHEELVHSNKKKEEKFVNQDGKPRTNQGKCSLTTTVPNESIGDVFKDLVLPRYDCHLCSKSYKMKGSLLVHYRVAHLRVNNPEVLPTSAKGGEERNFRCSICSKSFKKEQNLTQHIKTHEGKQWKCETCNKHFTTKYFLRKHQRLHTGEMPYSCQKCNKTFTFQQSYHKHLLYHSDEKPHQCFQCGRSFKELSTLHNHQRIHSGEKPFACETCGKCFRQRVSYIVHQRIHTGVLPYQCTACKKKFRYKVSQRSHKCTAQPPGIVVRQPGDLIQRILEQRNDLLRCSQ